MKNPWNWAQVKNKYIGGSFNRLYAWGTYWPDRHLPGNITTNSVVYSQRRRRHK